MRRNLASPVPLYNLVEARGELSLPAGEVLLQSFGLHGDFSHRINKEAISCSELFIALTHKVFLEDAASAKQREGPCKILHA